jgi:hypothetical protein
VALSNGDGTFKPPRFVLADFGFDQGWRVDRHPRLLVDLTGDGRADIVGFGDAGVYVALSNGDGTFTFTPVPVINDFGFSAGGWRVDRHPRLVGVLSSSHHADIVGFGNAGVIVARGNGNGTFQAPQLMLEDFGFNQGWRVEKHPRFLADVTGEGRADVVGFGDAGVYVARTRGNGTFDFTPVPVLADFGFDQGWRVEKHPRFLADVTGERRADIVGFGDAGVYVARSNANGTFAFTPVPEVTDFGVDQGWRVDRHPRFLADLTGDGRADIVGFGDAGVYVSLAGRTAFGQIRFVLPNFGFLPTILALVTTDREARRPGCGARATAGNLVARAPLLPAGRPTRVGAGFGEPRLRRREQLAGRQHRRRRHVHQRHAEDRWRLRDGPPRRGRRDAGRQHHATGGLRPRRRVGLRLLRRRHDLDPRHRPGAGHDRRRGRSGQRAQRTGHGRVTALAAGGVRDRQRQPGPAAALAGRLQPVPVDRRVGVGGRAATQRGRAGQRQHVHRRHKTRATATCCSTDRNG